MLAKDNRLRHAKDIVRVYKQGRYGGGGDLSVKVRANNLPMSRAVVIVGKKIDKRAVVRNRTRRQLAAILLRQWGTVAPGYDIVVSVHRDLSGQTTAQLEAAVDIVWGLPVYNGKVDNV